MGRSIKLIAASIAIAVIGFTTLAIIQYKTGDYEFVKESEYPIVSSSASMLMYETLEEMQDVSVLTGEIYIKNQYVEYIGESQIPTTWSEAEILQVYKGDKNIKTIKIGEVGGLVDNEGIKRIEKEFDKNRVGQGRFYEQTLEGSPVMKTGNTYIVMLGKGVYENTYEVVGGVQGKIRISSQTGKGVVTIDPDTFAEHHNDYYMLQRKFAGKKKTEIAEFMKTL